jgi:hypothetical protein
VHLHRKLRPEAVPALQSWLTVYAGQLLNLELECDGYAYLYAQPILQLPLNKMLKLQHLHLTGFKLQLLGEEHSHCSSSQMSSGFSSTMGSSRSAQLALSSLDLKSVELADVSSLVKLTKAPQPTSLKAQAISFADSGLYPYGTLTVTNRPLHSM